VNPRPVAVCLSSALICPKCGKPIRRVQAGVGSFYATCENTARLRNTAEGLRAERCGQHVYALGTPDGLAVVVPITRAEFEVLTAGVLKASHVVLSELGAVTEAAS
jgi:hypothetical protein